MKKNIFFFCILLLYSRTGSAQDTIYSRIGITFGFADNIQSANFSTLPGIPGCCANFTSGDGSGVSAGLLYQYPLSNIFLIGARFNYTDHSSSLSSSAGQALIIDDGGLKNVPVTRVIDLVASSYGIESTVEARIIKGFFLSAGMGIRFISSAKFIQRDSVNFVDSSGKQVSEVRNQYAGNLPNAAKVIIQGIVSLGYEFPLGQNHTTFLVPEITYSPAFTNIVKGLTWKTNAIIYAIAMKFSLN